MGRKKRKVETEVSEQEVVANDHAEHPEEFPVPGDSGSTTGIPVVTNVPVVPVEVKNDETVSKPVSSSYAITSHSGEIITEDIYVSDGSVDSDDDDGAEIILTGSRMGLMRRGLHQQMMALQQPNRQWKRQDAVAAADEISADPTVDVEVSKEQAEEIKRQREEEELAQLDPAQRAARLLLEKQKREAEAKIEERRLENEENVMRDPTLFSKRTAFDIRFDQIDDKPWLRGGGTDNVSDFFNYGLSEEDWLEYAEQQLLIRQELIDAARQKRPPDPTIVPIQARFKQEEAAVVAAAPPVPSETSAAPMEVAEDSAATAPRPIEATASASIGPTVSKPDERLAPQPPPEMNKLVLGPGGAWGAGAVPGSLLARLMEEQENGGTVGGDVVMKLEAPRPEDVRRDEDPRSRTSSKGGKKDRDHYSRRSSDMDSDTHSNHHREMDDHPNTEEYDYYGGGGSRHRSNPPGWPPPPPGEAYSNFPPPAGYHGSGGGGRGGRGGGRVGNFPGRGGRDGGRGGRGSHDRDVGGRGAAPDYYQDAPPPSGAGWKRSRSGGDARRRH